MNKTLFQSAARKLVPNKSGGLSYELSAEQALAQLAVTCTFNGTYYSSAESYVDKFKELLGKVRPELAAKLAVYSHTEGAMKDVPAFILSHLFANGNTDLVEKIFNQVITNSKMLCNFVQFVRSGTNGRKSFGTSGKRLIQNWLTSRTPEQLFKDSVGHSAPSLMDIIRMVHPKFNESQNEVVKYLFDREYNVSKLPDLVQRFETIKGQAIFGKLVKFDEVSPEGLDFRLLSNVTLTSNQWKKLATGMSWKALRMNLNNLQKHGVFDNKEVLNELASKLGDSYQVRQAKAFPYQLMTTFQNTTGVPTELRDALQRALEAATENVPNLGRVAVCVDVSYSMQHSATGVRYGSTSVTKCVDVAALVASCVLRTSDTTTVVPFSTRVHDVNVNRENSVLENARKLSINGGGTACSSALAHLVNTGWRGDVVWMVSDNESWADYGNRYRQSPFKDLWNKIKGANPGCKLILLDITPNMTSQMHEDKDVLHVAGFSDTVFEVVKNFISGNGNFLSVIEGVQL